VEETVVDKGVEIERSPALSTAKAAKYLRMSRGWLDAHADEIPHYMMGEKRLFLIEDLDAYLEKVRRGPAGVSA